MRLFQLVRRINQQLPPNKRLRVKITSPRSWKLIEQSHPGVAFVILPFVGASERTRGGVPFSIGVDSTSRW
jgi:hypothetical protein